jgi:two-component system, OmpR family, phosphate regulon response regulator OmpR
MAIYDCLPPAMDVRSRPLIASNRRVICIIHEAGQTRDDIVRCFEQHGYHVQAMESAEALLSALPGLHIDALVLDVSPRGMSGLDTCRAMRQTMHSLPILMLSSLTDVVDRVVGLEVGADDYLCKPFDTRELLARMSSLFRRARRPHEEANTQAIRIGDYIFVPATRSLHQGSETRVLNTVEYAILAELCRNPGSALTREHLLEASHRGFDAGGLRSIDAGVMRLRRLVEPDPSEPRYIQTVRGVGYMFVPRSNLPLC